MPDVILYVASSLDGYIARPDGNVDWLDEVGKSHDEPAGDEPEEDFGYSEFIANVGVVLMGRTTYEQVLSFGVDYPYPGTDGYVFSRTKAGQQDENVSYVDGNDIPGFISGLKETQDRNIWLIGGGLLVQEFVRLDLIDRIELFLLPVILGEGIPLFPAPSPQRNLWLEGCRSYRSGMVQLTYVRPAADRE